MTGILYGVGVGPGDPGLMTLLSIKTIAECDVIGLPAKTKEDCRAYNIALGSLPEIAEKEVVFASVPMTKDVDRLNSAYDEAATEIVNILKSGKSVAFLNIGDPTLYGTYMEIHNRIVAKGLEAVIINGVPSICAVAAKHGIALGERQEQIHIIPGSYGEFDENLQGNIVLMKSGKELKEVKNKFNLSNFDQFIVSDCGTDTERVYNNIDDIDEHSYFTTVILKRK